LGKPVTRNHEHDRTGDKRNQTRQAQNGAKAGELSPPFTIPYLPHSESRAAARLTNKLLLLLLDFSRVDGGKKK